MCLYAKIYSSQPLVLCTCYLNNKNVLLPNFQFGEHVLDSISITVGVSYCELINVITTQTSIKGQYFEYIMLGFVLI